MYAAVVHYLLLRGARLTADEAISKGPSRLPKLTGAFPTAGGDTHPLIGPATSVEWRAWLQGVGNYRVICLP